MLVTVKEWLTSVLNYGSYPNNKSGYPFFGPPCILLIADWCLVKTSRHSIRHTVEIFVGVMSDVLLLSNRC